MKENERASLEMRIRDLEAEVEGIKKTLRELTGPRKQRDTTQSPAPQRNITRFGATGHVYVNDEKQDKFDPFA